MLVVMSVPSLGHQGNIEFIEDSQVTALVELFDHASPIGVRVLNDRILGKKWSCDLYGIKSRLQKVRGVQLYDFSKSGAGYKNTGSQVTKAYSIQRGNFIGTRENLKDQVRLLEDGRLISRLRHNSKDSADLAIATCVSQ